MDRIEYWNKKYFDYWMNRIKEADEKSKISSRIIRGDKKIPASDIYLEHIKRMPIKSNDVVLELGCGSGRAIPFLAKKTGMLFGLDIAAPMLKEAKKDYDGFCKGLILSEAEVMPFMGGVFDAIICFGTFDALYQKEALTEMNRVLKTGGIAMISGKNAGYRNDDTLAMEAEINARKKGHPNFFTDTKKLLNNISCFGFRLMSALYFEKRGDMTENKALAAMPEYFYEYIIFVQKTGPPSPNAKDMVISSEFSRTYGGKNER